MATPDLHDAPTRIYRKAHPGVTWDRSGPRILNLLEGLRGGVGGFLERVDVFIALPDERYSEFQGEVRLGTPIIGEVKIHRAHSSASRGSPA